MECTHNFAGPSLHLKRAKERTKLRTHHPHTLYGLGPETDCNPDWRYAGLHSTTPCTVKNLGTPCCTQVTKTKDSYLYKKLRSAETKWRAAD
jgi:hypothetical protein